MPKKQRIAIAPLEPGIAPDSPERPPETLLQQIQQLSPDEWQGKKVYLYRVWPIIDKKGDDHFLAKLCEPIDEDYVLKNWGSGRYHLRLNGARGEALASQTVAIHNPDYPPRVDPLEVVESEPRNKVYFEVWGPRAAKTEPTAAPADSAALQELSKLASKVLDQKTGASAQQTNGISEATTTLLLGMSKGRDELAEKLAQHTGAPAPAVDPLLTLKSAAELLRTLQPQPVPAPAPPDLLSQIDKLTALFEKLKPIFAPEALETVPQPSAHTKMAGWQEFLQPVLPEIMKSVAPLFQGLGQIMVMRAGQNGPPQNMPPGGPSGAQPAAAQPPQDRFVRLLFTIVDPALQFIEDGASGADFAAFIYDGWGEGPLMAARKAGVEVLIAFYHGQPELWPRIAQVEMQFRQLLQDVIAWPIPDEEQTGEPSGSPTEPSSDASNEPLVDLTA